MIIYWSMVLWVPLIYGLYNISHKKDPIQAKADIRNGVNDKIPLIFCLLVFGYFIFWIGNRKYVFDTYNYLLIFNSIPKDFNRAWSQIQWEGKGPAFEAYTVLFKCFISLDYTWWLMSIAIICGLCVLHTIRKYSVDFFFSSFMFITLLTFTWMMNGMRQFFAVAVIFAFSDFLEEGKFLKYAVVVLLMTTFHPTCILMIPFYFVARAKPWHNATFVFIVAILLICFFADPFFAGVDNALSNTAYSGSVAQFSEDDGVNPIRVAFFAVFPIGAFILRKKLEPYYEKYPMLPISINMSLITAALYLVGVFTSGILIGRLPIYCEVFNHLLVPYILILGLNENEQKIVKPILVIVLLLFFYLTFAMTQNYHSDLTGYVN